MSPRVAGIAALVVGLVLLIFGLNASNSVADSVSEGFTGRFTDTTMWYLVGGGLLVAIGLGMTVLGRGRVSA